MKSDKMLRAMSILTINRSLGDTDTHCFKMHFISIAPVHFSIHNQSHINKEQAASPTSVQKIRPQDELKNYIY